MAAFNGRFACGCGGVSSPRLRSGSRTKGWGPERPTAAQRCGPRSGGWETLESPGPFELADDLLLQAAARPKAPQAPHAPLEAGGHCSKVPGAVAGVEQVELILLAGRVKHPFAVDGPSNPALPLFEGERREETVEFVAFAHAARYGFHGILDESGFILPAARIKGARTSWRPLFSWKKRGMVGSAAALFRNSAPSGGWWAGVFDGARAPSEG